MLEECTDTIKEAVKSEPTGKIYHRPGYLLFGSLLVLLGLIAVAIRYSADIAVTRSKVADLQKQVNDLRLQFKHLAAEQALPGTVLNLYRNSIGYIYASYSVGFPDKPAELEARVSGTGFLVSDDLVATNRHIAEPWLGDPDAQVLIQNGARPELDELVIFFPDSIRPVPLRKVVLSNSSDLAILGTQGLSGRLILPLAKKPPSVGDSVVVSGYPLGLAGMIARSPAEINQRLTDKPRDMRIAEQLATLSLIRPLVSCGKVGDIVGNQLVYDAPTAHGGSGAPVFNSNGEVVAVNSAFIDGFSGGSMGISVESLRQLLDERLAHGSRHLERRHKSLELRQTVLSATSK